MPLVQPPALAKVTHAVGTQGNRLDEAVLSSTQDMATPPDKKIVTILTLNQLTIYSFKSFLLRNQHVWWVLRRTCVVGTQKNRLHEAVPLSTQKKCSPRL